MKKKLLLSSEPIKAPNIKKKMKTNKSGLVSENQYLVHIPIPKIYS